MKEAILAKIAQTEQDLGLIVPDSVKEWMASFTYFEVDFGNSDTWLFYTLLEIEYEAKGEKLFSWGDNYMTGTSEDFQHEWKMKGMVIADNGCGDYLFLVPENCYDASCKTLSPTLFIMLHETAELKRYSCALPCALETGGFEWRYPPNYSTQEDNTTEYDWDSEVLKYIDAQKETFTKLKDGFYYRIVYKGEGEWHEKPQCHTYNWFVCLGNEYVADHPSNPILNSNCLYENPEYTYWEDKLYFGKARPETEALMQKIGKKGIIECIVAPSFTYYNFGLPFVIHRWTLELYSFHNEVETGVAPEVFDHPDQLKLFKVS
jgi:hypothetical protein